MSGQAVDVADGRLEGSVDAKALANIVLDWADADAVCVSPMKLQKLLYFCHADYLTQYGLRLIRQEFEAWDYGPVVPCLYAEFKRTGNGRITERATSFDPVSARRIPARCVLSEEQAQKVYAFYRFYSHMTAEELSDLSHVRGGPWRHARSMFANGLNMDRRISDEMIRRFHRLPHI